MREGKKFAGIYLGTLQNLPFFVIPELEMLCFRQENISVSSSGMTNRGINWGRILRVAHFIVCITLSLTNAYALPDTQKFETYLNRLKTLKGEFIQINSNGQKETGALYISRPGKMRLDYNPPSSLLIVANGKWLLTYDKEADEANYVSVENTPATFILRPHIRFSGDVAITSIIPKGEATEISLVRTDEPDTGTLSLVFTNDPVSLKEWRVIDGQGTETRVVLSKIQSNIPLPAELFMMESPNLIQQIF